MRTHVDLPASLARNRQNTVEPASQCVTSDYFRALGIPILVGRSFAPVDAASKVQVALVNHTDSKSGIQIIGIVKDSPYLDLA